ncbi:MAG: VWA domain-containing protein [Bacteroidales bacterium]|nr:VWA domain-containing protein [Bacteroidales bacterium]MDD4703508.1 VWA domain-containing protein [Bacteroidales bacterium]
MIRTEFPEALYLLILIPVFFVIHYIYIRRKKQRLKRFVDNELINTIVPELSYGKLWTKFILLNLAFMFLVIAISNPQIGTSIEKSERKGTDLMICLDISNSMLAEDIKPNRISRAKQSLNSLIDQLSNDRIGIVIFAGSAYVQLPITNDYSAAKTFIDIIDPSMISNQGTAIGEALEIANESFGEKNNNKSRSIILISDGEDNEEEAVNIAKKIAKDGVIINTIGLGLAEGALIPINKKGASKIEYKKDANGSYVMTKLNEDILKDIATSGNGVYIKANNASIGLDNILARINKMDKNEYQAIAYKDYENRFYIFAFIALLFLIIEFFVFEKKNKYINRKFFFGKE